MTDDLDSVLPRSAPFLAQWDHMEEVLDERLDAISLARLGALPTERERLPLMFSLAARRER